MYTGGVTTAVGLRHPHSSQNIALAGITAPQPPQRERDAAGGSGILAGEAVWGGGAAPVRVPHSPQKSESHGMGAPQWGHILPVAGPNAAGGTGGALTRVPHSPQKSESQGIGAPHLAHSFPVGW